MKSENKTLRRPQNLLSKSFGFLSLFFILFISSQAVASIHGGGDYEAGKTLFDNNCASCHTLDGSVLSAPSLKGVADRWVDKDELIVLWIQNPQKAFAQGDDYVTKMVNQWQPKFGMMQGQAVNAEEIKSILTYVSE